MPNEKLKPQFQLASSTMKNIDPNDVEFIACALAYPESVIWSDDKHFKEQNVVRVVSTVEMIELMR